MANKDMTKCSISLVIGKLQIKTSMRYHSIISKVAEMKLIGIAKMNKDGEKHGW